MLMGVEAPGDRGAIGGVCAWSAPGARPHFFPVFRMCSYVFVHVYVLDVCMACGLNMWGLGDV